MRVTPPREPKRFFKAVLSDAPLGGWPPTVNSVIRCLIWRSLTCGGYMGSTIRLKRKAFRLGGWWVLFRSVRRWRSEKDVRKVKELCLIDVPRVSSTDWISCRRVRRAGENEAMKGHMRSPEPQWGQRSISRMACTGAHRHPSDQPRGPKIGCGIPFKARTAGGRGDLAFHGGQA